MPQATDISGRWPLQKITALLRESGMWPYDISSTAVAALVSDGRFRHFAKGHRIARRTERSDHVILVLDGSIRILMQLSDGREFLISLMGPGDFCELLPCLDRQPAAYDVITQTEADALQIEAGALRALMRKNPEIQDTIVQLLCRRLRHSFDGLEQFAMWSPSARVAARLLGLVKAHGREHPDGIEIAAHFQQETLAAMVGLSRQRTNKILRDLEKAEVLVLAYRNIVVRDVRRLREELRTQRD